MGTGPIGVIAGSVIRRMFAPNVIVSVDASPQRNEFDEVRESTFDHVFDALPTVTVLDEQKDPRRVAVRKLKPKGHYVLYGAPQEMQKFDTWLMLAKGRIRASAPNADEISRPRPGQVVLERCVGPNEHRVRQPNRNPRTLAGLRCQAERNSALCSPRFSQRKGALRVGQ